MIQFRLLFRLMAFMKRRWKVLVVLNVFAVAVFIIFSSKYDVWMNKYATGHIHLNRSYSDSSHEVPLKTLVSLEDVVNKELIGLSKSIGLIEGFRNKSDVSDTLSPEEEKQAKNLQEKYGYNVFLSDRISLDRSIPDYRPSKCKSMVYPRNLPQISIIFIFVNEALSVILRSLHSAINHTPPHLLKEIILVDDYSDDEQLKGPLEEYVNKRYPGLVKIVRNQKREGLIRARIEGWKVATGDVTGFFDAHVEFTPVWSEPVLSRIKEDHKRIILPSIDNIKHQSFDLEHYGNSAHGYSWELWCMYISPPQQWWDEGDTSAPIRTPAMIGCSFVVNRQYFGELGLLDSGMDVYGGENIELGIKVWMCGGSMEVLPCSRVAHVARTKKPYNNNIGFYTRRNVLRVAEVWMDEHKSSVYVAWNIPMENHGIDYGDISERVALRKRLQCKNFEWYLDNVYPQMRRYNSTLFYGEIRNSNATHLCMDQGKKENHAAILYPCHGWNPQLGRYTKEGYLFVGPLGSTADDTRCIIDDMISSYPQLVNCDKVSNIGQKTWNFAQNEAIVNRATGRCLEVVKAKVNFDHALVLQACTGQRWTIKNTIKEKELRPIKSD